MPKNRKVVKLDGVNKKLKVPAKKRIGSRSSGTSANLMSNKQLLDVLTDVNKSRYREQALTVLRKRNVDPNEVIV